MRKEKYAKGFSLLELSISMAALLVFLAVVVPVSINMLDRHVLKVEKDTLVYVLRCLRLHAVASGEVSHFFIAEDGHAYIYSGKTGNMKSVLSSGVKITASGFPGGSFGFSPTGAPIPTAGTLKISNVSGAYILTVNIASGMVRVKSEE